MTDNEAKVRTNDGREMPKYAGSVFGQALTAEKRFPTGKRFPFTTSDGKTIWLPVMEGRTVFYWVWDGASWLTDAEFTTKYKRSETGEALVAAKGARPLVSKHDFNALGEPSKMYGRHQARRW